MTSKQYYRIALTLAIITVSIALGGIWYWAIFGLSAKVGQALMWTGVISALGMFGAGMLGDNAHNEEKRENND